MTQNEVAEKMLKYWSPEKNVLKVLEECAELSEVLLKFLTKTAEFKPPIEKITEEMGDVIVRCRVLAKGLGIEQDVENRISEKFAQIEEWMRKKYE